jgi:16S rRNA (guanine(966)-N(2))-methyltransferase RsmD
MRVIAGRFGGRRLADAPGVGVRPTAERVREALFSALGDLEGARVLDLYAGTGALGIEALSRGASAAVFVEQSRAALAVLRRNLETLELNARSGPARVIRGDACAVLRRLGRAGERFDLVLLDPPYASDQALPALEGLVAAGLLAPEAEVVLEASRRHPVTPVAGLVLRDQRRYGDTLIARFGPEPADRAREAEDG